MTTTKLKNRFKLRGFTLIELTITVTIIALLAVVALPQFINISREARIASVRGVAAEVSQAAFSAGAKCMVTPGCFGNNVTWLLTINNGHYQMWNGYPDAGDAIGTIEIDALVNVSSQFTVVINSQTFTIWQMANAPDPATCSVQYQEAPNTSTPPVVTTQTGGC